ncbi:hypothetical protein T492DRAFT_521495 [Pavlovales sp. CCMP2436]|nr:hypothetical protein T492DRAFT_521495 [Pavlovales sp. CCMP2436]
MASECGCVACVGDEDDGLWEVWAQPYDPSKRADATRLFEEATAVAEAAFASAAFECAAQLFARASIAAPAEARSLEGLAQCLLNCDSPLAATSGAGALRGPGDDPARAALSAACGAVRLAPEWAEAWLTCARAALHCAHYDAAERAFETAAKLSPALAPKIAADLADAARLRALADERTLIINGRELTIAQGRADRPSTRAEAAAGGHNGEAAAAAATAAAASSFAPPAILRAEALEALPECARNLAGKCVLELGSGTGVAGARLLVRLSLALTPAMALALAICFTDTRVVVQLPL